MKRSKGAEVDLGRELRRWLTDGDWEVYQEVTFLGGVIDVCAVRGPMVWAIELKMVAGLDVLVQALRWTAYAHLVSIAVPRPKASGMPGRGILEEVAPLLGVGVIRLTPGDSWYRPWHTPGSYHRPGSPALRRALLDGHKNHAEAGSPGGGGRWTPYRQTCEEVRNAVRLKPGMTVKQLVDAIQDSHHYANPKSARASLFDDLAHGKIRGVVMQREPEKPGSNKMVSRLYPKKTGAGGTICPSCGWKLMPNGKCPRACGLAREASDA